MADALALVQALPPPLLDQQTVTLYFIVLERSESLVRLVADVSYGLRAHQLVINAIHQHHDPPVCAVPRVVWWWPAGVVRPLVV